MSQSSLATVRMILKREDMAMTILIELNISLEASAPGQISSISCWPAASLDCDRSNTFSIFPPSEIWGAGDEMGDVNKSWVHCTGGDTVWTTLGQLHHWNRDRVRQSFL